MDSYIICASQMGMAYLSGGCSKGENLMAYISNSNIQGGRLPHWDNLMPTHVGHVTFQKRKFDGLCKHVKNDEFFFALEKQNCFFRKFPKRKF